MYHVSAKADKESFAAWVARVGNLMADGYDVIYQMPFVHDGVRGVADFLERVERPDGSIGYEPVDAKLTRADAKTGPRPATVFLRRCHQRTHRHRP